ncbi:unnamed protein product [Lasius platythorax]|uniref:RING-type domain-containing protein n=1 Tax=Lasius platythorax TaxID=488582 RepID=A0AAV2PAZ0_9HYME
MDIVICNKCFIPMNRGKRPFNVTQCGHVFCPSCIQQVEEQCFQCKCNNPGHLPLEEPLMPKMISLLTPFSEILELLLNVEISRDNQMKITIQRFRILDNKYEMLKKHYLIGRRNIKILLDKYTILKTVKKKLDEELKQLQQMQKTPQSTSNAPMSSGSISLNSRYSSGNSLLHHLKFFNLNLSNTTDAMIAHAIHQSKETAKVDDSGSPKSIKFFFTSK